MNYGATGPTTMPAGRRDDLRLHQNATTSRSTPVRLRGIQRLHHGAATSTPKSAGGRVREEGDRTVEEPVEDPGSLRR